MATETVPAPNTEAAILSRLVRPEQAGLTPEAADALLKLRFDAHDLRRLHELIVKNQGGDLNPAETAEFESYLRISSFLDLLHAKARLSLKNLG